MICVHEWLPTTTKTLAQYIFSGSIVYRIDVCSRFFFIDSTLICDTVVVVCLFVCCFFFFGYCHHFFFFFFSLLFFFLPVDIFAYLHFVCFLTCTLNVFLLLLMVIWFSCCSYSCLTILHFFLYWFSSLLSFRVFKLHRICRRQLVHIYFIMELYTVWNGRYMLKFYTYLFVAFNYWIINVSSWLHWLKWTVETDRQQTNFIDSLH